jgi:hypothetical protein
MASDTKQVEQVYSRCAEMTPDEVVTDIPEGYGPAEIRLRCYLSSGHEGSHLHANPRVGVFGWTVYGKGM